MKKSIAKKLMVGLFAGAVAFTGLSPMSDVDNTSKVEASVPWVDQGYWNGDRNYPRVYYRDVLNCYLKVDSIYYHMGTAEFNTTSTINNDDSTTKTVHHRVGIKRDNNGGYHIYDLNHGTKELTGYVPEEPTYSAALYVINYLGL